MMKYNPTMRPTSVMTDTGFPRDDDTLGVCDLFVGVERHVEINLGIY